MIFGMPDGATQMSWTITSVTTVSVLLGAVAELTFAVTNNDPGPDPRRGTLRMVTVPPEIGVWCSVDRPTRTFAAAATEQFTVTVTVPADALPGAYELDCFVVVTDDPSTETTVHSGPVALQVGSPVPWSVTAVPAVLTLEAGKDTHLTFRVGGPPGQQAELGIVTDTGPALAGWFTVDRPTRVLGAAPEDFAVTISPPPGWPGGFGGRFSGVVTGPPAALHAQVGYCGVLIPVGGQPSNLTVSPDGSRVYVSNPEDTTHRTVTVLDAAAGTVAATILLNGYPRGIAVSPDGRRAYVADLEQQDVIVLDTVQAAVLSTIPLALDGDNAQRVVVSPDGRQLYAASGGALTVIDTAGGTVTATHTLGWSISGLAVHPDGSRVYVTWPRPQETGSRYELIAFDPTRGVIDWSVPVGDSPFGVAISPDGSRVYVTMQSADTVTVVDTATRALVTTVPVGTNPMGVAVSPDGRRVYTTGQNGITVIDTAAHAVLATVPVGSDPFDVVASPDGLRVYVANLSSGDLSVIDTSPWR